MFYSPRSLTKFTDYVMLAACEATPFTPTKSVPDFADSVMIAATQATPAQPVRSYLMYMDWIKGGTFDEMSRATGLPRERVREIIHAMRSLMTAAAFRGMEGT